MFVIYAANIGTKEMHALLDICGIYADFCIYALPFFPY